MQKVTPPMEAADLMETFSHIVKSLEPEHFGEYVMIDPASKNYVIAPTVSEVHTKFIETFGAETRGHCLRIGASPFVTA